MKLPAHVLAKLCLTGVVAAAGCETTVDFERRSAPPAKRAHERGEVQHVEVELGRIGPQRTYATPPPATAPRPAPLVVPVPASKSEPKRHECGPCGMG